MAELDATGTRHAVSPVSAAELSVGSHRASAMEFERADELLESLRWLEFDRSCARRTGRLQAQLLERSEPTGVTDCMIAATAIEHGEPVVTRDEDFERIPDVRTIRY